MKISDFFKIKTKSTNNLSQIQLQNNVSPIPKEAFVDFLLGQGFNDLAAHVAVKYYGTCAPLADSIDRISREIASIEPLVFNTKTDEFSNVHPVLDLLKFPNADSTYEEYITKYVSYFLLTGESFNISTGNLKQPPLELFNASPVAISVQEGTDGYAQIIRLSGMDISQTYNREEIKSRFRYYNSIKDQEVFQTKNFNPKGTLTALRGKSILQAIYYEIEQYINSGIHNLSNLKRGATLSGLLSTSEDLSMLSDDQRQSLKEQINNYFGGSENAGRIGFLDKGITFTPMQQSNKDMDFRELKKDTETTIYSRLGIPLPLISEKTMTMTNLPAAKMQFYDQTILPLANRIFSELTLLLMYRYKNSEDLIITFNPGDIIALEPRRNEELQKLQATGVLTINELRAKVGYGPVSEGGDSIYLPSTDVPIADDLDTDNPGKDQKSTRKEFIEIMQAQVNRNGEQRLTNEEIEEIADNEGL